MDFIVYIKTDDIFKDIIENVEIIFDTPSYELDRPLPKGKNKKIIGLMKDKLGRKIMTKLVELKAKSYNYWIDDGSEDRKAKDRQKCVMKRKFTFENYNNCLKLTKIENKIKYLKKVKLT